MPTIEELKEYCRIHRIRGYSNLRKEQLIKLIQRYEDEIKLQINQQLNQQPSQQLNYISKFPNVLQSEIGSFLNFEEAKNYNIIEETKSIFSRIDYVELQFKDYDMKSEYNQNQLNLMDDINLILRKNKNIKYIRLNYLHNNYVSDNMLDDFALILELLISFEKLEALEISFPWINPDYSVQIKTIFDILIAMNLKYLNFPIETDSMEVSKEILESSSIKYFRLQTNDMLYDEVGFESKVETLNLSGKSYGNIDEINLEHFPHLRRLILEYDDSVNFGLTYLEKLMETPMLEVLEVCELTPSNVKIRINYIPKTIKFLRIGNFEHLSFDNNLSDFFASLLTHLSALEYLYLGEILDIKAIYLLLATHNFPSIRYIHIEKINYSDSRTSEYITLINNILKQNNTKLKIEYLHDQKYTEMSFDLDFVEPDDYLKGLGLYLKPKYFQN